MLTCQRCEIQVFEESPECLCVECYLFLGRRGESTDRVCYFCCDTWHADTLPMCENCYLEEGGLEHAH